MRPRSRLRPLGALATGLVLVATGCTGEGAADDARPTTTAPTTEATTATTATIDPADPTSIPADPSSGCGATPDAALVGEDLPGDVEQTIASGGRDRPYRLGVPADYDPEVPVPLVVNLHGSGSDAIQASIYGDVPRKASDRGVMTIAAQGIEGGWELGDGADSAYITAVIDDVEARYCVDRNRVHGIGNSLGAAKIAFFSCQVGDRFASLALVTVEVFGGCTEPMPVVAFHGTADAVVAYGEGGTVDAGDTPNAGVPGTLDNIAEWAENGGCAATAEVSTIGGDVELRSFPDCEPGVDVALYTIQGGGHTWPGSDIIIGPTTETIDATELALDWFAAHPRRP